MVLFVAATMFRGVPKERIRLRGRLRLAGSSDTPPRLQPVAPADLSSRVQLHTAALSVPALQFRTGKRTLFDTAMRLSLISTRGRELASGWPAELTFINGHAARGGRNAVADMQHNSKGHVCVAR
jgi:hypothetical protein